MTKTPLILASSSRYRRELLDRLGLAYTTVSPDVDETPLAGEAPAALALRLAHLKAEAVAKVHPDAVVIGSDQVCDLEGTPLGKPHTFEKAVAQLKAMQGKRLVFHTAVCVIAPSAPVQDTVSDTVITMRALSDVAIRDYVEREKPFDCAGSAKIEKLGIALMDSVTSDDPTSLIGLPLMRLTTMLTKAGLPPVAGTRRFLAENARSARRFLKAAGHPDAIDTLEIIEIGHAPDALRFDEWLSPLTKGDASDTAIVSESGCPAVADPGAGLVRRAHELGIPVKPLVGPSSLLLTLMASGMNGQRFRFLGYLPIEKDVRREAILAVERESAKLSETELFIETPYRNNPMLGALSETLHTDTLITVATDVTGDGESIVTRTAGAWKKALPELPKLPTVFAVFAVHPVKTVKTADRPHKPAAPRNHRPLKRRA